MYRENTEYIPSLYRAVGYLHYSYSTELLRASLIQYRYISAEYGVLVPYRYPYGVDNTGLRVTVPVLYRYLYGRQQCYLYCTGTGSTGPRTEC